MSYISVENMYEYAALLESRVRMDCEENRLIAVAQKDYRIRMAIEQVWGVDQPEYASLRAGFLAQLDERVNQRMAAKEQLHRDMDTNRRARRQWHEAVRQHIHSIVCNHCNPSSGSSTTTTTAVPTAASGRAWSENVVRIPIPSPDPYSGGEEAAEEEEEDLP